VSLAPLQTMLPMLQAAIGPVILISGVGLLLLTMTNRLGRTVDRARLLAQEVRGGSAADPSRLHVQLQVLTKRARLLRRAIWLSAMSVLLAATLIIAIFIAALFHIEIAWLVALLFVACMLSLIGGLAAFMRDLDHSLVALNADIRDCL
jgi:hypothetical protein